MRANAANGAVTAALLQYGGHFVGFETLSAKLRSRGSSNPRPAARFRPWLRRDLRRFRHVARCLGVRASALERAASRCSRDITVPTGRPNAGHLFVRQLVHVHEQNDGSVRLESDCSAVDLVADGVFGRALLAAIVGGTPRASALVEVSRRAARR